ncbi:MAG TPA: winged helix-turn-helix domain-containing protein [Solirubrobacterales bacterium]|nr:winged helix-turn-helix domain-containing protein [Solirubrobacterales bacterium]
MQKARTTSTRASEKPKFESTLTALLAHPTRVQAFCILAERTASPIEIAHEIRKDVSHVGYHVSKLVEIGHVELVGERPVRGAVEHFYRATKRPFASEEDSAAMSDEERDFLTRHTLQLHMVEVARSVDGGTFDKRLSRWLLRLPFEEMDDEGFDELGELFGRMYEEMLVIKGRASIRKEIDPDHETFPATATAMFFETPGPKS